MSKAPDTAGNAERKRGNATMLRKLIVVTGVMFGFGFAMVPFYKHLCEVTGLNNVLQPDDIEVSNTQVDTSRSVTMQFDTNLRNDLPWTFRPLQPSVQFHPGELVQVDFEVRNNSNVAVTGQAIPSWGPKVAGQHLKKLDCFCFSQQTLQPGEVRKMPVVFVIDKALPEDVNFVTMSYTFFKVEGRTPSPSSAGNVEGRTSSPSSAGNVEGHTSDPKSRAGSAG